MMAVKALSSNISSARDSSPSQSQSFAINARTAQNFTVPMYKFPPPDNDTTEASATQDGGRSTSGFGGWPFTPQRRSIPAGQGHPTSNAFGDSASREPTSPTFSVQSGSTRSNKSSDMISLCSSSSASRVSFVPRCFYVPHVTPASWLPGSKCC
jgi:hypothetical protein